MGFRKQRIKTMFLNKHIRFKSYVVYYERGKTVIFIENLSMRLTDVHEHTISIN